MKPNRYDRWIASSRPPKRPPSTRQPVAAFVERETLPDRRCGNVGTIILSNRECPYRCVFCGLWQQTIDHTPKTGDVAAQVEQAIEAFGDVDAVKLYNAGSFFDEEAIPPLDRERIADLCRSFEWVIVESRPELIDARAVQFARTLRGRLQIAIGIEVADDQILALLNKRMSLRSIRRATQFMQGNGLSLRAFIIVQPPFVAPSRAVELANATADFAAHCGADTITLIRAYSSPGVMEQLLTEGFWVIPDSWAVYDAARHALEQTPAVTLVDRWSLGQDETCPACVKAFDAAFSELNTEQRLPPVTCNCRSEYEVSVRTTSIRSMGEYRDYLRENLLDVEAQPKILHVSGGVGSVSKQLTDSKPQ